MVYQILNKNAFRYKKAKNPFFTMISDFLTQIEQICAYFHSKTGLGDMIW